MKFQPWRVDFAHPLGHMSHVSKGHLFCSCGRGGLLPLNGITNHAEHREDDFNWALGDASCGNFLTNGFCVAKSRPAVGCG